jgi:hypothetical protein
VVAQGGFSAWPSFVALALSTLFCPSRLFGLLFFRFELSALMQSEGGKSGAIGGTDRAADKAKAHSHQRVSFRPETTFPSLLVAVIITDDYYY